ncbi:MAG: Minf_1886 family protein [Planctomycetota bacterium]
MTAHDGIEERILFLRRRDRRFARNAYLFLLDALDHTMVQLGKDRKIGEERHVGARELLDGIRDFASAQFGPMAPHVFQRWGLRSTQDFGEIVFNLVDAGLLSRRAEDSRLDFSGGFDFEAAFAEKFNERLTAISHPQAV